jgi:hypothetical protein
MAFSPRTAIALIACFLAVSAVRGQPAKLHLHDLVAQPTQDASAKVDRHGDALPPRATARFGTGRLRHDGASAIAFSPDSTIVVSLSESELRLWDTRTGKEFPWLWE